MINDEENKIEKKLMKKQIKQSLLQSLNNIANIVQKNKSIKCDVYYDLLFLLRQYIRK